MMNSTDAQISLSLAKTKIFGESDLSDLECSNPLCSKFKSAMEFRVRFYENVHQEVFQLQGIKYTDLSYAKAFAFIESCSLVRELISSHFHDYPPFDECLVPNCAAFKKLCNTKIKFYELMHHEVLDLGEKYTELNFAKASGFVEACLVFENYFHSF